MSRIVPLGAPHGSTEAGGRLHDLLHQSRWRGTDICAEYGCDYLALIIAIETEARADAIEWGRARGWTDGRADAWTDAKAEAEATIAERLTRVYETARVDALREVGELVELHDQAVLAIRVAALREAADAVRDAAVERGDDTVHITTLLAILDPEAS